MHADGAVPVVSDCPSQPQLACAGRGYTNIHFLFATTVNVATVVLSVVVVVAVTLQSASATEHGVCVLDQAELSPEAVERIAVWTAEAFPAVEWQA